MIIFLCKVDCKCFNYFSLKCFCSCMGLSLNLLPSIFPNLSFFLLAKCGSYFWNLLKACGWFNNVLRIFLVVLLSYCLELRSRFLMCSSLHDFRSSTPGLAPQSPEAAPLSSSSIDRSRWKITRK